jgi:hypothetical protein
VLAQAAWHAQPAGGVSDELQHALIARLARRSTGWLRLHGATVGSDGRSDGQHERQDAGKFRTRHLSSGELMSWSVRPTPPRIGAWQPTPRIGAGDSSRRQQTRRRRIIRDLRTRSAARRATRKRQRGTFSFPVPSPATRSCGNCIFLGCVSCSTSISSTRRNATASRLLPPTAVASADPRRRPHAQRQGASSAEWIYRE